MQMLSLAYKEVNLVLLSYLSLLKAFMEKFLQTDPYAILQIINITTSSCVSYWQKNTQDWALENLCPLLTDIWKSRTTFKDQSYW